ncbi:T-box protein 2 [Temnothorax longispinosus]|uniref:T-box protein 2 n=1 Tax=Temnothorax longispinosus TaxID=300112 RepID=A0A4S2L733_9HYME|nr:T-box protein 2 [Temnothorax longispinosus]
MSLELNMQLASPLFAQSPIALQRKLEMIITKSGRRMLPSVQINISGLEKRENYYVFMEIAPASDCRHKYCGYQNGGKNSNMGGWSFTGPAEPQQLFSYSI